MGDPLGRVKAQDMLALLTADGRQWKDEMPTVKGEQITEDWEGGEQEDMSAAFAATFVEEGEIRYVCCPGLTTVAFSPPGLDDLDFDARLSNKCVVRAQPNQCQMTVV